MKGFHQITFRSYLNAIRNVNMPIPIGIRGFVTNEGICEPYVFVQDDLSNTGGYLILTSSEPDFFTGYDN